MADKAININDLTGFIRCSALMNVNLDMIKQQISLFGPMMTNEEVEQIYFDAKMNYLNSNPPREGECAAGGSEPQAEPQPETSQGECAFTSYFKGYPIPPAEMERTLLDSLRWILIPEVDYDVKSLSDSLQVPTEVVLYLLDKLNWVEMNYKIVPKILTEPQKLERVQDCEKIIKLYNENPDAFRNIIYIDEIYLSSFWEITSDTVLRPAGSSPPEKKARAMGDKKVIVLAAIHQGKIIAYQDLPENTRKIKWTVDGETFRKFLEYYVKPEINRLQINDVHLMYDNSSSHSNKKVDAWLEENNYKRIEYPAASADMFPPDYDVFVRLISILPKNTKMSLPAMLAHFENAVKTPNEFTQWEETELIDRLKKIIEQNGRYLPDAYHKH